MAAGHVKVARGPPAESQVSITLRAIHRTESRSGKNSSAKEEILEEILWENQRVLPGAVGDGDGVSVPIAVPIHRDVPQTSAASPKDRILWRLELKSAVPGVDFQAQFEVPVFDTDESETPLTPEEAARFD